MKVRAKNVTAIVRADAAGRQWLTSGETEPVRYAVLEYCARPTCERVFKAERGWR